MPVALEQFVKQLADSGVIAPGKLESFVPPKAQPKDAQELARLLILSKQLTKYQVQEIYQGRAKSLILGNYTILDKIGAGGMGQVFKAEHRRMHRVVAIKMLPKNVMQDAAAAARFQREVEAASKLMHPNIVSAFDADEANGVHFLAMEFVEGSDLSALVKKNGPFPIATAVNYILQAAKGLEFAHGEGVVHRDIKPANLLLDKKGTVKILDMGLARISTSDDAETQAELTGTGAVLGTVDYMAPEQALSTKHADARADIYSLGCSLHYLVTGKATFGGDTLMAKLLAHRDQPIPSLGADAPEQVQAIFEKMVAKKVEDRYQTMSEVVADLQECVAGSSTIGKSQTFNESPSDDGNLSFLAEATAHTQHHKPTKLVKPIKETAKPSKKASGWNRKQLLLVGGGLLGGLILIAGIIVKLRTKDGTLVVEINQPDAVVQVLDADGKIEVSQPGGKEAIMISVDPGKHRLKVEKNGFQFFAKDFEMESGGTASIKATLVEDKPWFKPAFLAWQKEVAALPAEKQVDAVVKKLRELNPGFDGKVENFDRNGTPKIENGAVTELLLITDNVTDIAPLRAMGGLRRLICFPSEPGKSAFSDLSPLQGMRLTFFQCDHTRVANLSPLAGMPLAILKCRDTQVSDLSPLKGMPLTELQCDVSRITDLSPLKGMPLTTLYCNNTQVSDLSPLQGMNLKSLWLTPEYITKGIDVIRQMKSLGTIAPGWGQQVYSSAEFWKKYDTGEFGKPGSTVVAPDRRPIATFKDPAFQQWMKTVAVMPAEQQVVSVAKKLQELNPGFDGKLNPLISNGVVIRLDLTTDNVTDISPIRVWPRLPFLLAWGSAIGKGKLADLSPLQGISLTSLVVIQNPIVDVSPLKGMPLEYMRLSATEVSDLTPLANLPLKHLELDRTPVVDLAPLRGLPLEVLTLVDGQVRDLSPLTGLKLKAIAIWRSPIASLLPLRDIPLEQIFLDFKPERDMEVLRSIKTLKEINSKPIAEFWKEIEATSQVPVSSKSWNTPAFQQWMKTVASTPAEQQVDAVAKKLQELNPGFDGKVTPKIEGGVVTELKFSIIDVTAISPVRALVKLKFLACTGTFGVDGKLSDLSPLKGMSLTSLDCWRTQISDLSPLRGMPLTWLHCNHTTVSDLSPLQGMQLTDLLCDNSPVSDLSPLKGMPLTVLHCNETRISDFSPLEGMNLTRIAFTPKNITKGIDVIRRMKSLQTLGLTGENQGTPPEFWKKYDAGEFGRPTAARTGATLNDPAFRNWVKTVAAMAAEQQVQSVATKLQQLNPRFDGSVTPKIEGGVVTEVEFVTDNVTDISPVWALPGLKKLTCHGSGPGKGILSDLLPLKGMPLTEVDCGWTKVADLSPLEGMPLTNLSCGQTPVSDLSPLKGMPLTNLGCEGTKVTNLLPLQGMKLTKLGIAQTQVADLTALKGMSLTWFECNYSQVADLTPLAEMPLKNLGFEGTKVASLLPVQGMRLDYLGCVGTPVTDLSPLHGMSLKVVQFTPKSITNGLGVLRQMKSLKSLGTSYYQELPTTEFWKRYDAGEFGR